MSESRILVWDFPTRVFHWLLAASFFGAYATGEAERFQVLHVMFGYTVAGLVAFRLLWGFLGTRYARWSGFEFSPRAALAYARSLFRPAPLRYVGHNPLGSWSVVLLLGLQLLVFATGLAALLVTGVKALEEIHEGVAALALVLVAVHIGGVIVSSLVHRENLVRAMVSGNKRGAPSAAASGARPVAGLVLAALVIALWSGIVPVPGGADLPTALTASAPQHGNHGHHDD